MLRATTACTFSTSQLPKVVRSWCGLHILTWKCASRHNGVDFVDISASKSGLRMVCLCILSWKCASRHSHLARWLRSEVTFTCVFYLLTLSLLWSSHLCFPSLHIVGSLTSKLPSIITLSFNFHTSSLSRSCMAHLVEIVLSCLVAGNHCSRWCELQVSRALLSEVASHLDYPVTLSFHWDGNLLWAFWANGKDLNQMVSWFVRAHIVTQRHEISRRQRFFKNVRNNTFWSFFRFVQWGVRFAS